METIKIPYAEFRRKCSESFAYFAAHLTDCGDRFRPDGRPIDFWQPELHEDLCIFLQYGGNRQLIELPRGFLKSHFGARLYPIWDTIQWADHRTLLYGNTTDNARKRVNEIRSTIEEDEFKNIFPEIIPDNFNKTRWSDDCADVKRPNKFSDGTFESAGLGKRMTGRHKTKVVEDDTGSPDSDDISGTFVMPSREDMEKAIGIHKLSYPLLIDPISDKSIVIGTPWCFYDLIDYIKKYEPEYKVFKRIARWIDKDTGEERYLYPKRFPKEVLEEIERRQGPIGFSALYLLNPRPLEEMVFQPAWTQYYDEEMPCEGTVITILDPIPPESGGGMGRDYAAIVTLLLPTQPDYLGRLYVLDYKYGRFTVPEQDDMTFEMAKKWDASRIKVESNFFQKEMFIRIQNHCAKTGEHIVVEAVNNVGKSGSKDARIIGLTQVCESKLFFIRRWMKELENEMYQFVPGKTRFARDDLLDAISMGLTDYRSKRFVPEKQPTKSGYSCDSILEELEEKRQNTGMRYGMRIGADPNRPI